MTHRIGLAIVVLALVAADLRSANAAAAAGPAAPPAAASAATTGAAPGAAALPELALAGSWYVTEVLVFERPLVGTVADGEELATDAARSFPNNLESFEPAGSTGAVHYPVGAEAFMCLHIGPGAAAPPSGASEGAPVAFAKPLLPPPREPDAAGRDAEGAAIAEPAIAPVPPDPREELLRALHEYEQGLEPQSMTWLPDTATGLSVQARRLTDSGGYRVLFHHAWMADIAAPGASPAILVQSAQQANGTPLLEGTVRLARDRGLLFETALWYRMPEAAPADPEHVELRDARRLGDGQLHYIDHPKLGVIVRTTPLAVPAQLSEAWAALNPPVE